MAKTKNTDDDDAKADKAKAAKPAAAKADKAPTDKPKPGTNPVPVHIGGDSIADRLMPHVKKIAIGAGVIALILTAVFGVRWYRERARGKKTVVLAKAMDVLRREVKTPDPTEKPDPTKPPKDPTFATFKDRAEAGLTELKKGGAPLIGDVYRAGLMLDAGKLDDAEKTYRAASTHAGLDGVLAREGLGFVAEARAQAAKDATERQHQLEAALAAFRSEQPDDKGMLRDHALYHEARMLTLLDKKTEAVAALEKALEVAPASELEPVINERLSQLGAEPK